MCGIVGEWRQDGRPVHADQLAKVRDTLTNRGPDDAGLHIDGSIGLGHRRLSIIDLSPAGRMPMSNETNDVWAVFNGEIYNFATLRDELVALGHTFRSRTDSEVVIHAYEQWGTESFARYDGMFAIAIWDRNRQRLVLARDITGEKPLFYDARPGTHVRFASTLRALLAFPDATREIDSDSLRMYLQFGYVPGPHAIVHGARKVMPGSYVVFEPDRAPVEHRYYTLEDAATTQRPPVAISLEQATSRLQELLRSSVRARLVSDVPLGAFLSGGIDSSLVVAMMAETSASTVRTFTIGFDDPRYDESEHAKQIAKHLGVENTVMVLSAIDVLRELPSLTDAFDEPMADFSALPSIAVARLARQHVTVALTGDGADEAFGGYRYYGGTRVFERIAQAVPRGIRKLLASRSSLIPWPRLERAVRRVSARDAATYFGRSGFYRGATLDTGLPHILRPSSASAPEDVIARYIGKLPGLRPTEAGMLWDATHTLPDAWLTKVDRTTMQVGLEARAPFLDRKVLELAFGLPLDLRVRGNQKKILLRELLSRYMPRELFERPKQGFTAPLRTWFAGELKDELHARLSPERVAKFEVIDPKGVQHVLAEQSAGTVDHTQLLWALFHLDRWHETFITGSAR